MCCKRVTQTVALARLAIRAVSTARFNALCNSPSAMWCRCRRPVRGSMESREEGKTYCHRHSRAALGNFRPSANGRWTLPNPSSMSCSCCALIRTKWRRNGSARFTGNIVTRSFPPFASRNLRQFEIDILDSQADAFHQTQSATVKQAGHQLRHTVHVREHALELRVRKNHGKFCWSSRSFHVFQPSDFLFENITVEKEQGTQRLVLGGRSDVAIAS
jgi:hypothetical protein